MNARTPWVFRLPRGLREQPGWVFLGGMCALAGLSYVLGIAESNAVTDLLNSAALRVWGGFLCLTGTLVVCSTIASNKALEVLSLRFLSVGLLMYLGWIAVAVPIHRAVMTLILGVGFSIMAEVRIAVLRTLFRVPVPPGEDLP